MAAAVIRVASAPSRHQPDFRTFYFAALITRNGGNPYDVNALSSMAIEKAGLSGVDLPFLYPPHAILLFTPFTLFSFFTAYYLWLAIKVVSLLFVTVLGQSWLYGLWRQFWPLLSAVMFNSALWADLRGGNVALLETALMFVAFVALTRGKPRLFGAMVAAASVWKTALLPFSALALLARSRLRVLGAAIPLSAIGALLVLNRLLRPDLWHEFRAASSRYLAQPLLIHPQPRSPRGGLNASSPRLLSDISYLLFGRIDSAFVITTYCGLSLAAVSITCFVLWRNRNTDVLTLCIYGVLVYGLVIPRLTQYSYVLFLAPTVYVLNRYVSSRTSVAVALFACTPFFYIGRLFRSDDNAPATTLALLPFEYSNLVVVATCWLVLSYKLFRSESLRDIDRTP